MSGRGSIKARNLADKVELQQPPPYPYQDANMMEQVFRPLGLAGWVFLLCLRSDWRQTEFICFQSLVKVRFLSSVFLVGQRQMMGKISRKKASYPSELIYVECFHRVLYSVFVSHLVGR